MYYPKAEQIRFVKIAKALYHYGWRARDRDGIKEYYQFSDDEADIIVAWLRLLE